jgi:hypothetical protein
MLSMKARPAPVRNDDAIVSILTNLVEQFDELGVRISVKDERIAVGV